MSYKVYLTCNNTKKGEHLKNKNKEKEKSDNIKMFTRVIKIDIKMLYPLVLSTEPLTEVLRDKTGGGGRGQRERENASLVKVL